MVAVGATVEVVEEADPQLDGGKVSRVEEVEVGLKIEGVQDIMGVKRPAMVAAVMAAAAVDVTRAVGVFVVLNIYKMVMNIYKMVLNIAIVVASPRKVNLASSQGNNNA